MSFGGGGGSSTIGGATDVAFGAKSDKQFIEYNNSLGKWTNVGLTGYAALPTGGGVETLNALGTQSAGTVNVDLGSGNVASVTLGGSITMTFSGATSGKACSFGLYVTYNGAFSITWPTGVKWASGTVPTQTSTGGATDVFVFETLDGGTTWYGSLVGANFS